MTTRKDTTPSKLFAGIRFQDRAHGAHYSQTNALRGHSLQRVETRLDMQRFYEGSIAASTFHASAIEF